MQARYAVEARIDVIQVRERDLETAVLLRIVAAIVTVTRGTSTRVIVNDRVDVALAAGADGVHLRGDSLPPAMVRSVAPHGFLIGRSVHAADEASDHAPHVDYLIAGTVWPSASKPRDVPLLGIDGLSAIARSVTVPVLAIGGVTVGRCPAVARSGAAGGASDCAGPWVA